MPSVTSKLLSASIVTESDLWRIGPSLVAVNPTKMAAVQAYIESLRFGPMLEWLSRGYYATDVGINETDYSVVLYRKTKVLGKPTTSALVLNHCRVDNSIGGTAVSGTSPFTVVAQLVWGTSQHFKLSAASAPLCSQQAGTVVTATNGQIMAAPFSRVFANKMNVGNKHTYNISPAPSPSGIGLGGAAPADSVASTVGAVVTKTGANTTSIRASTKDWPLIEGPSVMTYGEVVVSPLVDFTAIFCNNADVAAAIRAGGSRYNKDVSTLDIIKRCDERPSDGFCYFRNGNLDFNPLSMIPEMADQADELLAGDMVIDGVDYSAIRTKWGFGAAVVGAYSSGAIDTSTASTIAGDVLTALNGSAFASFTVDSSNRYTLTGHAEIATMGESEFNAVAISLIAVDVTVSVGAQPGQPGASKIYADDANARIADYARKDRTAVVSYDGCGPNVGHMLCAALLTDQKSASVKLARGFVVPAYLTTV